MVDRLGSKGPMTGDAAHRARCSRCAATSSANPQD
jgi:hypothetical protein